MTTVDLSLGNLRARLAQHVVKRLSDSDDDTPHAAVAIVLRYPSVPSISPEVLLIKRTDNPRDPWSGHMAFPGGRCDEDDNGLLATAIRESREEVGISLDAQAELLGRLDDVPAIGRGRPLPLIIAPFLFVLLEDVPLVPQQGEVDEALWAAFEPLTSGAADTTIPYVFQGEHLDLPAYRVGQHIVWGLTYRMMQALFELAGSSLPFTEELVLK